MKTLSTLMLGLVMAAPGEAAILAENLTTNANSATFSVAVGQSVTTPSGGPWTDIRFNFYTTGSAPWAEGTLFVLSQEYTGSPGGLSAATPGFLALTNTISAGVWQFAGLVLQPDTQYFFMASSVNTTSRIFNTLPVYGGGLMYATPPVGGNYIPNAGQDMAFTLQGTPTAVPEAGSAGLLLSGALAMSCLFAIRRVRA